jgi:hypothetical protein
MSEPKQKYVYIHAFWYVSSPLPTRSYKSGEREYHFSMMFKDAIFSLFCKPVSLAFICCSTPWSVLALVIFSRAHF